MLDALMRFLRFKERNFDLDHSPEDPDIRAATEELEDFLQRGKSSSNSTKGPASFFLDPELEKAFKILGLPYKTPWPLVKATHRELLIKHHPDKHTHNAQSFQEATRTSQAINEAFQKLKKYYGH